MIVISGVENLHVHVMVLLSFDLGFTTEVSSRSTTFFFLEERRSNKGFNLLIMMLHCERPSLISISALTSVIDWRKGPKQKRP
jgi:hypothetical protein